MKEEMLKSISNECPCILGIDTEGHIVVLDTDTWNGRTRPELRSMELLTEDDIENGTGPDAMYEARDMWVEDVKANHTDEGLEEWWDSLCSNSDGYFPYDDDSYRYDAEYAYEKLDTESKATCHEVLGYSRELDDKETTPDNAKKYVTFNYYTDHNSLSDIDLAYTFRPDLIMKLQILEQKD